MRIWYALVPLLIGLIVAEALFEERQGSGNLREIQTRAASSGEGKGRPTATGDAAELAWTGPEADDTAITAGGAPADGALQAGPAGSGNAPPSGPEQIIARGGARIAAPLSALIEKPAATD